jgi:hypothetical protein
VKDFAKALALIVGSVVGVLAALYGGLYSLFDGLSTARIAGVVLIGVIALVIGVLLCFWLVGRLWTVRQSTPAHYNQVIPGDWQPAAELPGYRPPQMQLPAPRVINVPTYRNQGAAQPYNMPQHPVPILQTTTDAGALSVPLDKLMRFLSLPGPRRAEWTGKPEVYGACLAFCVEHGLLTRQSNGGARWKAEYPLEARKSWAEQFEHYPTDAGADPAGMVSDR